VSEFPESHNATIESAGTALGDERRRQSLSIGDVSRHLKLSVRQVEALENDEFEVFGGSVFVHGFLRNYAKLLGLDPGKLIQAADRALAPPAKTEIEAVAAPKPDDRPQKSVVPLLLVAAILIAGVFGWMATRESGPPAGNTPSEEESGSTQQSVDSLGEAVALTEPGAEVQIADDSGSASPGRKIPDVATGMMRFVFDEESWVEVTDRYGEVIFSDLGPQGETRRISGQSPLSLVIGNAAGVKLTYNDKAIDLAPHTRVDVARLTLE
jgi:cytoskeleton protein RodZ